jgi:ribosomal protein L40E
MNSNDQPEPKPFTALPANGMPDAHPQPVVGDEELRSGIAELTRSRGQTIDNDSRILIPIAISELMPLVQAHTDAAVKEVAQFNWICQPDVCGAYNPYDCRRCRVCGKERPGIYTQIELDAAVKAADRRTLETIASLLNGDASQVEVVKGYVRNKLEMYQDRLTKGGE